MIEWNDIVWALCVSLLFFLLWKEVRRKNKNYLPARLVVNVLLIASFLCLLLRVSYTKKMAKTSKELVILTEGYNKDSVLNFIKKNSDLPVIRLHKAIHEIISYDTNYVTDLSLLPEKYKDVKALHVFGYGFTKDELSQLHETPVLFHPGRLSSGITHISWTQKVKAGEKVLIEGKYLNATSEKVKILLSRFAVTFDSAYVPANTEQDFHFNIIPKNEGRNTYTLSVVNGSDTMETETVAMQVEENRSLSILMLSSAPDFDTKFLKNDLSEQGFSVAARSRISKAKYATSYINTASVSLDHITSSLLDKYDMLIADASELNVLSKAELAGILAQIAQKGMGLIIKEDTLLSSSFLLPVTAVFSQDTLQQLSIYLLDTTNKLPAIISNHPLFFQNIFNSQRLVWDRRNRQYVISALSGSGKIIISTLPNTYTWVLSGNKNAYDYFWTTLLNKAAKPSPEEETWHVSPTLPLVDHLAIIRLQTDASGIPQGQVNGASVYLENNPDLPYQWSGVYYPKKEGWQTGIGLNGKPFYWYAYGKTQWGLVFASQKIIATKQYALQHPFVNKENKDLDIEEKTAIPKIWFFIVFALCCGFLWLESKNVFVVKK